MPVVQVAKLKPRGVIPKGVYMPTFSRKPNRKKTDAFLSVFDLSLGFGKTESEAVSSAKANLDKSFFEIADAYEKGWADCLKTLPKVDPKYQAQFNMAAMVLKAQ